ncbi:S-adenosylmethionine:tRNA ribosyltransferase-isomerase [Actinokineospora terrae]|uniref:S-adenosylmethionine--tRNA ribosyltransferase-isomerase n=1 Tax=Actinokineospora terrae TaxID=155974 RepID=A0A1H9QHU0_9PSEU|nr:S-adenosylmethionine:tRNA ribosyltransferase-isomerase [Actinokineospora terrae]SER59987.1 S-adenosylmethionine--tRNA ribosyltransferase-isomerase [Actinokineospora terrae]
MTTDLTLPAGLDAHEPPEARGLARDGVRLLVSDGGELSHHRFSDLPSVLRAGDVLVVNTSGTLPASVAVVGGSLRVHLSTENADGTWLLELRSGTQPYPFGAAGDRLPLVGGASVLLRGRYSRNRLWEATIDPGPFATVQAYLAAVGEPIRYGYVPHSWPLRYYQTVFGVDPGSAEMPSAGRPFTDRLVTRLVAAGVQFAPVLLHTGVASPEAHERPYPEWFRVSAETARMVNAAKADGRRVIAVGTTAVRAVESAVRDGVVREACGWTELVVTPERGVAVVDGLLTGFHEASASHVDMLVAVAGRGVVERCYAEAVGGGYLWHEFGDVNLLVR